MGKMPPTEAEASLGEAPCACPSLHMVVPGHPVPSSNRFQWGLIEGPAASRHGRLSLLAEGVKGKLPLPQGTGGVGWEQAG